MAVPKLQLLSRTQYDTDGTTTIWDFNFSGGYILQDHVKAYWDTPGGVRTVVTVTPAMLVGTWQLEITPAVPAGNVLTIYRATPKDQPMVDFVDRGVISEVALDTLARQAVFVAAEASDDTITANSDVAVNAAVQAQTAQALAASSAVAAGTSAAAAAASASAAATSASNAAASAVLLDGSTATGLAVLKAASPADARTAIGAQVAGSYAASGANADITGLSALTPSGLPNSVVTTTKIADSAVTSVKIAGGAVTSDKLAQPLTRGTSVNTTSGTAVDFTGIPSWVKRITVMFNGVSLSGTSNVQVQLGTSGGVEATGYASAWSQGTQSGGGTTGFVLFGGSVADARYGAIVICNFATNAFSMQGATSSTASASVSSTVGFKTLAGTLDRIRITSVNGTDTFDAGAVNILYEG